MRKLLVYFAILLALSAITSIPGVALVIVMATLAIGMPILLANTLLIYSAALLPTLAARRVFARRWLVWPLGALTILVLALVPAHLSRRDADANATALRATDVDGRLPSPPRVVELRSLGSSYGRPEPAYARAPCDDICQRLLFNGVAEKVRITRSFRDLPTAIVTYSLGARDHCPEAFGANASVPAPVRQRMAAGTCLIADPDDRTSADAIVTVTQWQSDRRYLSPTDLSRNTATRQVTIQSGPGEAPPVIHRQTELKFEVVIAPFFMWFENGHTMNWGPPTPARRDIVYGSYDVAATLAQTFGAELPPVAELPTANNRSLVERALSRPAEDRSPMTVETIALMNDYLRDLAKYPTLEPADVDLIRRLIADPRVEDLASGISALFGQHPRTATVMVTEILNRIAIPISESRGHYHAALAHGLYGVPSDQLRPHSAKIFQILRDQPEWHTTGLLVRVGELEGDAVGFILEQLQAKSDSVRKAAVHAACRLDPPLAETIRPVLIARLHRRFAGQTQADDVHKAILLALVRHGAREEAFQIFSEQFPGSVKWATQQLGNRDAGFPVEGCRRL